VPFHPLAGVSYTAFAAGQDNGVGATTDGDGVATLSLSALGGGTINVALTAPAGYKSAFVACSEEYGAIESGLTFADLAPDAFVTCQWYFVSTDGNPGDDPGGGDDGSLTLTTYACPEAWDGKDYAACREHPQEGVAFTVVAEGTDNGVGATTDANGSASFALFAADLPGDITVVEDLPAGYVRFEAACQTEPGIAADYAYTDTGITLIDVQDGAEITCAWFNILAADDGDDDRTPTPPSKVGQLPNTGVGQVEVSSSDQTLLLTVLSTSFVVIARVAVGRWRRT